MDILEFTFYNRTPQRFTAGFCCLGVLFCLQQPKGMARCGAGCMFIELVLIICFTDESSFLSFPGYRLWPSPEV